MSQRVKQYAPTLMVARSLEKALVPFFSASAEVSASVVGPASDFLPKAKGKEDFRLSALGTSFFSPLTAGVASVVSIGTVAGLATSALRGSVVSGLGMTGAV